LAYEEQRRLGLESTGAAHHSQQWLPHAAEQAFAAFRFCHPASAALTTPTMTIRPASHLQ
jgi:hypothetical protein